MIVGVFDGPSTRLDGPFGDLNVRPRPFFDRLVSGGEMDTKPSRELGVGPCLSVTGAQRAHFCNQGVGEFGRTLSSPSRNAALCLGVGQILCVGPEKEMRRIDASSHVAAMADMATFWNLPEVKEPRRAVGSASGRTAQFAVPVSVERPRPQPTASVWFWCVAGPESVHQRSVAVDLHVPTEPREKRGSASGDSAQSDKPLSLSQAATEGYHATRTESMPV